LEVGQTLLSRLITFVSGKEGVSDFGGEAGAREAGKLRLEGKEYEVADGDVIGFPVCDVASPSSR